MAKNKLYVLSSGKEPVAYKILSRHRKRNPLTIIDEEKGIIRELRYATNMTTPFVDEQDKIGKATIAQVWFRDGVLDVRSNDLALINFLDVHPDNEKNGGKIFFEFDPTKEAEQEIINLETSAEAMAQAKDLDIDDASAIVFNAVGYGIKSYSVSEIRRDLLTFALKDPKRLLEEMNDESLKLNWIAFQAISYGILNIKGNQVKLGKAAKSLLTLKPGMDEHICVAQFFLTDDGIAALAEIKKQLKKLLK